MNKETPVCNVCIGEKNINCICGGTGTIYGENEGLRRELYRLSKENEILKSEQIKKFLEIIQKHISVLDNNGALYTWENKK